MSTRACAFALTMAFTATLALAAPVQWPTNQGGNGNWYDFVSGTRPWTQAKTDAEAISFAGSSGYLATITSAAESNFVFDHFSPVQAWIGGYQDHAAPDYSEPGGGWRWVTGEPWSFTSWATQYGFPDNFGGNQDYLKYASGPYWDDLENNARSGGTGVDGFIIEFPAPEPSAASLMAFAGASLLRRRRRDCGDAVSASATF